MSDQSNKNNVPQWLVDIQNRSWEPEIIISGITLTFLFLVSDYLFNFYAGLIQEYGANSYFTMLSFTLAYPVLTAVKIALIFHLILRGFWTGLIGLSYVYPDGLRRNKLGDKLKDAELQKPIDWVMKYERICSLVFSLIFTLIRSIFMIGVIYVPVAMLNMLPFNSDTIFYFQLGIIFLSFSIYFIVLSLNNKWSIKLKIYTVNTSFHIFGTNLGKWFYLLFLIFFYFSIFLSWNQLKQFQFKNTKKFKVSESHIVKIKNNLYEKRRNQKLRLARASIQDMIVKEDTLELKVAYYREDELILDNEKTIELLKKLEKNDLDVTDILRITLDGQELKSIRWMQVTHPLTNQTLYETVISVGDLEEGRHIISIDKILFSKYKKTPKSKEENAIHWEKNWATIPFEYVPVKLR